MVTTVNRVKPLWTQVVIPIFKIEFGTIGSVLPFKNYRETSSIRLFSKTHQLEEKLEDLSKNDKIIDAKTPEPTTNVILTISKTKRVFMKYAEAEIIARKRGLELLHVRTMKHGELYTMVAESQLKAREAVKVKQHVMGSTAADHDFNIGLKKVAKNVKKHGRVNLIIKAKPGQTIEEPPEHFIGKVKDFVTENSLPFELLQIKSNPKFLTLSITNIGDELWGTRKKEKTVKSNTEDPASDVN